MPWIADAGRDEWACFASFAQHSAAKLQGAFTSGFWTTLLLRAGLGEPAVFHAVVAVGAVHRSSSDNVFSLQHYGKAIRALQPHFTAKERAARRVTLVVCAVFVALDLLRGHVLSAQLHLVSGLQILSTLTPAEAVATPDDVHIVEVFARLQVQMELF